MPIYEYRCQVCSKLTSFFLRSINSEVEAVCSHCQSEDIDRCMSSFSLGKTVSSIHQRFSLGSERRSPDYYHDPRNIGRGVEGAYSKFGKEMPQSVRDNIDAARSGEIPKGMEL